MTETGLETLLRERLAFLKPEKLELADESALHAGHAGAKAGAHFRLHIVSAAFSGKTALARHRLVNDALGDLLRSKIHALSIRAMAPDEG